MISISFKKDQVTKSLVAVCAVVSVLTFSLVALPVQADEEAVVNTTVTVQNVSVSIDNGLVAYGIVGTAGTRNTTASGVNDSQTATNEGNVTSDLLIKGANTADWTLASTAGVETYRHDFCVTDCDGSPTWTFLTTSNQTLASGVAVSGDQVFDLRISTPTSTSVFTEQEADVTVTAAAT